MNNCTCRVKPRIIPAGREEYKAGNKGGRRERGVLAQWRLDLTVFGVISRDG